MHGCGFMSSPATFFCLGHLLHWLVPHPQLGAFLVPTGSPHHDVLPYHPPVAAAAAAAGAAAAPFPAAAAAAGSEAGVGA
eukprot:1160693-Pelagomonas_calceolata.AAC.2